MKLILKQLLITTFIASILSSCDQYGTEVKVYITNNSFYDYEECLVDLKFDNRVVIEDSLKNPRVSGQWQEYSVMVKEKETDISFTLKGDNYTVELDTVTMLSDGASIFLRFDFDPYAGKYTNPKIYDFLNEKVIDFEAFVDSLYQVKAIVLTDTIPQKKHLSFSVQYPGQIE